MNRDEYTILAIDEINYPILIEDECAQLKPIITDFVQDYLQSQNKSVSDWLEKKLQESLPDRTYEEIRDMSDEIIKTIVTDEEKKGSLKKAVTNGRSKESWFASEMKNATSAMSAQEAAKYLSGLDSALQTANESLYQTITTQAGIVSQNPRLDGFIAEQYHAQTFNMNAEIAGSSYRAKVLEPNGNGYAKNSVDIIIVDKNGKTVRRYQSKYCKDAQATAEAFEHGDYKGQQKLIPEDQKVDFQKKCTTVIESPDGVTSNPLSKSRAEQMRDEAQSGNFDDLLNWNEYKSKDLAIGIGKQAGYAALQGAAIGVGLDVASKLWNGEEIKGEEIVETALSSGADFGVKAAAAGALKVGVEKGFVTVIPKGTPASTIANIAYVAIEDAKVVGKIATGELTLQEGIEKIEETTVSTTAGLVAMGKGAAIGAKIGTVFGPVGIAVGGFVGGAVGYMAGSKVGQAVVKGAQKVSTAVCETVKSIGEGIKSVASSAWSGIKSGFARAFSW